MTINGFTFANLNDKQLKEIKKAEEKINKNNDETDEDIIILAFHRE